MLIHLQTSYFQKVDLSDERDRVGIKKTRTTGKTATLPGGAIEYQCLGVLFARRNGAETEKRANEGKREKKAGVCYFMICMAVNF